MSNIADIRCRPSSTRLDGKSTSTQAQGCCIQSLVTFQRSRRRKRSRKPAQRLTIAYHDRGGRGQRARRRERDQASRQFVIIQGEPIEMATPAVLPALRPQRDLDCPTVLTDAFAAKGQFPELSNLPTRVASLNRPQVWPPPFPRHVVFLWVVQLLGDNAQRSLQRNDTRA